MYYNKYRKELRDLVQRKKLEKLFKQNGWRFVRHGGNHDIWTNGNGKTQIPRHAKIDDGLAKGLIKKFNLK